jgi:hypothetical protein
VRYQPVVVAVLIAFLIGAPSFYLVDAIAGMPRWWRILEFACCFLAGGVPLAVCLWPASRNMRCSEPGHRAPVAIESPRGPGR